MLAFLGACYYGDARFCSGRAKPVNGQFLDSFIFMLVCIQLPAFGGPVDAKCLATALAYLRKGTNRQQVLGGSM